MMASSSPDRAFWHCASLAQTTSFITRAQNGKLSASSLPPAAWKNGVARSAFAACAEVSAKPPLTAAPTATPDLIPQTANCSNCWNNPTCGVGVANASLVTRKTAGGVALNYGLPTSLQVKPAGHDALARPT